MRRNLRAIQKAPAALIACALLLSPPLTMAADTPPAGKTYFIASLGLATDSSEVYELQVGCLQFTATEMCDLSGECGAWHSLTWGEPGPRQGQGTFSLSIVDEDTGSMIEIEGTARVEARGRKSTIAGVALAVEPISRTRINFGFVGRQVSPAACLRLVEEQNGN